MIPTPNYDPFADLLHRKEKDSTMPTTTVAPFTEVDVATGVLQATAQLLEQLAEFFDLHPAARVALGHYLATRHEDAGDEAIEGSIAIAELAEAAELLHSLATVEQEG